MYEARSLSLSLSRVCDIESALCGKPGVCDRERDAFEDGSFPNNRRLYKETLLRLLESSIRVTETRARERARSPCVGDPHAPWPERTALLTLDWRGCATTAAREGRAIQLPCANERATSLANAYDTKERDENFDCSSREPETVYGCALFVAPGRMGDVDDLDAAGARAVRFLVNRDLEALQARRAVRAAVSVFHTKRVARIEEARLKWRKRAAQRVERLLPFVERAGRLATGGV